MIVVCRAWYGLPPSRRYVFIERRRGLRSDAHAPRFVYWLKFETLADGKPSVAAFTDAPFTRKDETMTKKTQ